VTEWYRKDGVWVNNKNVKKRVGFEQTQTAKAKKQPKPVHQIEEEQQWLRWRKNENGLDGGKITSGSDEAE